MQGGNFSSQSLDAHATVPNGRPNSHWLKPEELDRLKLRDPRGLVLAALPGGEYLRFNGDGHVMVFAPTGAGKGTGFVQPNLADYRGSCVCLDPKGENAIRSAQLRRDMGQEVIVLDPFKRTGLEPSAYNPLGSLTYASVDNLGPMIEAISDALIPTGEHKENPHWPLGAKKFCSFILWWLVAHEPPENRHLSRLHALAHSGHDNLYRMAGAMAAGVHPDENTRLNCVALGNWFKGRETREFSYFESQLVNNVGWVGDGPWKETLNAPPAPPLNLKDPERPVTIYLVVPFHRLDRYRPWLRVMVADLLNNLYDNPGKPDLPVLFMLDEAYTALGNMEMMFSAAGAVRSAGARLCFIYQDLPQVQKLFGQQWVSLLANSGAAMFWGVNDFDSATQISQIAGETVVATPGNPAGSKERLIAPERIMQLAPDEMLIRFRGAALGKFRRVDVVTDANYKNRLAPNPQEDGGAPPAATGGDRGAAAREWVPVKLDDYPSPDGSSDGVSPLLASEQLKAQLLAALSEEYGAPVFEAPDGRFGYLDGDTFVYVA